MGTVSAMKRSRAVPGLVALAVALSACSPSVGGSSPVGTGSNQTSGSIQTSEGGQVTAMVRWAGPSAGAVFDVKLDTHSIDLDALDLANAVLRNDRGDTMTARQWAAAMGGHHREGTLTFDGDSTAFFAGAKWIELVMTGVGDLPERTLRWEIGS